MIDYEVNPIIDPEGLFAFYGRNNICEVEYGPEVAVIPLERSSVIVAAVEHGELVGSPAPCSTDSTRPSTNSA